MKGSELRVRCYSEKLHHSFDTKVAYKWLKHSQDNLIMASPVNLNAVKSCKVPCFHQSYLLRCSLTTVTRIGKTHSSNCKVHSHTFSWSTCTKMRSNGYETTTSNTDVGTIVACYLLNLLRMLTAPHLIMPRLV